MPAYACSSACKALCTWSAWTELLPIPGNERIQKKKKIVLNFIRDLFRLGHGWLLYYGVVNLNKMNIILQHQQLLRYVVILNCPFRGFLWSKSKGKILKFSIGWTPLQWGLEWKMFLSFVTTTSLSCRPLPYNSTAKVLALDFIQSLPRPLF